MESKHVPNGSGVTFLLWKFKLASEVARGGGGGGGGYSHKFRIGVCHEGSLKP